MSKTIGIATPVMIVGIVRNLALPVDLSASIHGSKRIGVLLVLTESHGEVGWCREVLKFCWRGEDGRGWFSPLGTCTVIQWIVLA